MIAALGSVYVLVGFFIALMCDAFAKKKREPEQFGVVSYAAIVLLWPAIAFCAVAVALGEVLAERSK